MTRGRRGNRRRGRCAALIYALLGTAACGGGTETSAPASVDLQIADGDAYTDTIGAIGPRLLTVELHAGTRVPSGLVVRFDAIPSADPTRFGQPTILVSKPGKNVFGTSVSETTDAAGRVGMETRLGIIAGDARLVVSCPELGLADTATFTVLPGRPWRIQILPQGAVVRVGASYVLDAYVVDGNNNRRSDQVSYEAVRVVAVDPGGRVRAGQEIGHGAIAVRGGGLVDTARLTVLPLQKIAFIYQQPGQGSWIATALTDGSNLRKLVQAAPTPLSLSPSGDRVAYHQETGTRQDILLVDENGTTRTLSGSGTRSSAFPRFDSAGNIYFSGLSLLPRFAMFRMAGDGTGLTELASVSAVEPIAVSPDGARLIAQESGGLYLYSVAAGSMMRIGPGAFPAFSPDGRRLAYLAPMSNGSGIAVSNADGSAPIIHSREYPFVGPPAWLADSKWIITADAEGAVLVNASTGETLPLPGLGGFSWISTSP